MFFVNECSKNQPLVAIGNFCMKRYHVDTAFDISERVYNNFFKLVEAFYKPNPYHNSAHAADVLCSYLFLIQQSVLSEFLQDIELFGIIIANLCHDIGHPGFTNRFLVNSNDDLALTCKIYIDNDISVLEMMHCSTIFQLLKDPNCNIMKELSHTEKKRLRALIIDIILATDMSKHFDLIGKFKAKLINNHIICLENYDQRVEMMALLMKASDVAHAAKCHELHSE